MEKRGIGESKTGRPMSGSMKHTRELVSQLFPLDIPYLADGWNMGLLESMEQNSSISPVLALFRCVIDVLVISSNLYAHCDVGAETKRNNATSKAIIQDAG